MYQEPDFLSRNPLPLVYEEGDLTQVSEENAVLVHSCNTKHGWGAGVAAALARAFPNAERIEKQHRQQQGYLTCVGTCLLIPPQADDGGKKWIACLYSKETGGPPSIRKGAMSELLYQFTSALIDFEKQYARKKQARKSVIGKIYCPAMNADLFRTPWVATSTLLEYSGLQFNVRYLPGQDPRSSFLSTDWSKVKKDMAGNPKYQFLMNLFEIAAPNDGFEEARTAKKSRPAKKVSPAPNSKSSANSTSSRQAERGSHDGEPGLTEEDYIAGYDIWPRTPDRGRKWSQTSSALAEIDALAQLEEDVVRARHATLPGGILEGEDRKRWEREWNFVRHGIIGSPEHYYFKGREKKKETKLDPAPKADKDTRVTRAQARKAEDENRKKKVADAEQKKKKKKKKAPAKPETPDPTTEQERPTAGKAKVAQEVPLFPRHDHKRYQALDVTRHAPSVGLSRLPVPQPRLQQLQGDARYTLTPVASTARWADKGRGDDAAARRGLEGMFGAHMRDAHQRFCIPAARHYEEADIGQADALADEVFHGNDQFDEELPDSGGYPYRHNLVRMRLTDDEGAEVERRAAALLAANNGRAPSGGGKARPPKILAIRGVSMRALLEKATPAQWGEYVGWRAQLRAEEMEAGIGLESGGNAQPKTGQPGKKKAPSSSAVAAAAKLPAKPPAKKPTSKTETTKEPPKVKAETAKTSAKPKTDTKKVPAKPKADAKKSSPSKSKAETTKTSAKPKAEPAKTSSAKTSAAKTSAAKSSAKTKAETKKTSAQPKADAKKQSTGPQEGAKGTESQANTSKTSKKRQSPSAPSKDSAAKKQKTK